MARIRTVKPEFWTDRRMVKLSPLARLLYISSWNFALCEIAVSYALGVKVPA